MALTRRDVRFIALAVLAVSLCTVWNYFRYRVPQEAFSFAPDLRFRGDINFYVESGPPLTTFEIDLDRGKGTPHLVDENQDLELKNYCDPQSGRINLPSPNKAFLIACESGDRITVKRADGTPLTSHVFVPNAEISEKVWAPDSSAIAVLTTEWISDFTPYAIMSALSGHPISKMRYRVFVFSPQDNYFKEIPVLSHPIEGGWATVRWAR